MAYKVLDEIETKKVNFEFELICNEIFDLCELNQVYDIMVDDYLHIEKGKIKLFYYTSRDYGYDRVMGDHRYITVWKTLAKRKKSGKLKIGILVSMEDKIDLIKFYRNGNKEKLIAEINKVNANYDIDGLYDNIDECVSFYSGITEENKNYDDEQYVSFYDGITEENKNCDDEQRGKVLVKKNSSNI